MSAGSRKLVVYFSTATCSHYCVLTVELKYNNGVVNVHKVKHTVLFDHDLKELCCVCVCGQYFLFASSASAACIIGLVGATKAYKIAICRICQWCTSVCGI